MTQGIKRFLYLNYDSVLSCFSQLSGGISLKSTETTSINTTKSEDSSHSHSGKVAPTLGLFGSSIGSEIATEISSQSGIINNIATSQSVEKLYHDDLFNQLEIKLEDKDAFNPEFRIGEFVRISGNIEIVDIKYIEKLVGSKTLIDFVKQDEKDKIKTDDSIERKKLEKSIDEKYKNFDKIVKTLRAIIPYEKFIVIGDCLIDIDPAYLRDRPEIIAFKYDGVMTALGYVTNIIISNKDDINLKNNAGSAMSAFSGIVNSALPTLLGKKKLTIIHALGIYY